jgi:hypothetical protein
MEGEAQQPLLSGRRHLRRQVQEGLRLDLARGGVEDHDPAAFLSDEQPRRIVGRRYGEQRPVEPRGHADRRDRADFRLRPQRIEAVDEIGTVGALKQVAAVVAGQLVDRGHWGSRSGGVFAGADRRGFADTVPLGFGPHLVGHRLDTNVERRHVQCHQPEVITMGTMSHGARRGRP